MINKVVLVGRLVKDPELRKVGNEQISVLSFTLACNRRVSSKNQQNDADFINCVAWRQSADFLSKYASKGAIVGVEGSIQTRSYQNNQGQNVYVTEVLAESVQLIGGRANSNSTLENVSKPNNYNQSMFTNNYQEEDDDFEIKSDNLPFM